MSETQMDRDPRNRLMQAMQKMIMMMQAVDDTCVRLTTSIDKRDLHCISFIGDHAGSNMSDIAELLDVPMSTATGIIQKLVDKSLVTRSPSQYDRRAIQLHLSETGREIHELFNTMKEKMANRIMDDLSASELDTFVALLEKVTTGLKAHVESE